MSRSNSSSMAIGSITIKVNRGHSVILVFFTRRLDIGECRTLGNNNNNTAINMLMACKRICNRFPSRTGHIGSFRPKQLLGAARKQRVNYQVTYTTGFYSKMCRRRVIPSCEVWTANECGGGSRCRSLRLTNHHLRVYCIRGCVLVTLTNELNR